MNKADPDDKDRLIEEAAGWFARMRGPDSEASRPEFDAWLARGAAQRSAYNRAAEIFAMGKFLADEPATAVDRRRKPVPLSRLVVAASLAVLVLGAAATLIVLRIGPAQINRSGSARYSPGGTGLAELNAPREPRSIHLADGSTVKLEAGTAVSVDFSDSRRTLSLGHGMARFFVAHEARPFLVFAGGGYVTAHGTIFDVSLASDRRVAVRLIQGIIDVTLPSRDNSKGGPVIRRLRQGEGLSFAAAPLAGTAQGEPAVHLTGTAGTSQSASGEILDVDAVKLADLIAAANRGAARPIRLAEPSIGERRISGRFAIQDTDLLADRIALLFQLRADRSNPKEIMLRPR